MSLEVDERYLLGECIVVRGLKKEKGRKKRHVELRVLSTAV